MNHRRQTQILELPMTDTDTRLQQDAPRQNSWGWAFCCSLLGHVGVLLLLTGYFQETRPQLELTPPIKVSLIALPQQPKKLQPAQVPENPLPRPTQQKPQPVMQKHQVALRSLAPPAKTAPLRETQPERLRDHEPAAPVEPMEPMRVATDAEASNEPLAEVIATRTDRIDTQNRAQTGLLSQLQQNYAGQIRERINQFKRYPLIARKRGKEGVVALEFSLDTHGTLLNSRILLSSGTTILDRAALKALTDANPFTPPPPELELELETRQTFQVQIQFALSD